MELKPGQVIIFQGANFITQLQGDTNAKHVCMVGADPTKIWTTGAKALAFFGQVDAEKYLAGKEYILAEVRGGLTPEQLDIIENTNRMMRGHFYGFWKYAQLEKKALKMGRIRYLGKVPQPDIVIKNPICSQAVGCALWRAGIKVGGFRGKLDATALLPETFEEEVDHNVLLTRVN